ncbi:heavy metal translocating P-type ATPase [Corynebacterium choanae]|nr:heavy metal translocating P-type ATPase [Corynebacterium choanae]
MTDSTVATAPAEIGITGMTCTSCSSRIQRKLNKLPGVEANVNFATETAQVTLAGGETTVGDAVDTITNMGYGAFVLSGDSDTPTAAQSSTGAAQAGEDPLAQARAQHERTVRQRLIGSVVLGLPVMVLSMIPALQFDNWQWLCFALTGPVWLWGGWDFHRAAVKNLRSFSFTMDTLVSVGTTAAFLWSIVTLFFGDAGQPGMRMQFHLTASSHHGPLGEIYLDTAAMVIVFLLFGKYLEAKAKRASASAVEALAGLQAKTATVLRDGQTVTVPVEQVAVGAELLVRPGESIPLDGTVTSGHSAVDNALLTGESVPQEVTVGDPVTGGAINTTGRLTMQVTRVGEDTTLAAITKLVTTALGKKAKVQRLVDKIAGIFVPIVLVVAAVTLGGWLLTGHDAASAFAAAVAVLVIACPCALGLATPTALLVGTGRGAELGILISSPQAIEQSAAIDTIVLDKTGTITTGNMTVVHMATAPGVSQRAALRLAQALEQASEHPIAQAIVAATVADDDTMDTAVVPDTHSPNTATGQDPLSSAAVTSVLSAVANSSEPSLTVDNISAEPGVGIRGDFQGSAVSITAADKTLPDPLQSTVEAAWEQGATPVVLRIADIPVMVLVVNDVPKPSARSSIAALTAQGLTPLMVTGDNPHAAHAIAQQVGIPSKQVHPAVSPTGKAELVTELQAQGRKVAVAGDGINDAAALAAADLGLAVGAGTDVAIAASDITMMSDDLHDAVTAIALARRTVKTIRTNLFWAFFYNVALIPLAALGLINPMLAGAAMALSSIFVVTNSLRLKRFTLPER